MTNPPLSRPRPLLPLWETWHRRHLAHLSSLRHHNPYFLVQTNLSEGSSLSLIGPQPMRSPPCHLPFCSNPAPLLGMAGGAVTSPGLELDRVDLKLSLCYYQPHHVSLDESHPLAEPRFPCRSHVETGACPLADRG